jgi:drug/metabolite transporter (DMT)-like permease
VLIGAVSIFVYTRAVTALGPATTALFTAAVPCITTLLAIPLLSETPSWAALCGVGVVSLGMLAAVRHDKTPD